MHYGKDGNNKEMKHPERTSGQTLKKSTVKHIRRGWGGLISSFKRGKGSKSELVGATNLS